MSGFILMSENDFFYNIYKLVINWRIQFLSLTEIIMVFIYIATYT